MDIAQIDDLIRIIRGQRVMLDSDLAALYGVEVKQLKRQVRRNAARFPQDFLFELTRDEQEILRCQIGTLRWGRHSKYSSYAFTEQGVAMLSGVLNSGRAVQVNVAIMRAFVRLRRLLAENKDLSSRMENAERMLETHEKRLGESARQIREVFEAIRLMLEPPSEPRKKIGF